MKIRLKNLICALLLAGDRPLLAQTGPKADPQDGSRYDRCQEERTFAKGNPEINQAKKCPQ